MHVFACSMGLYGSFCRPFAGRFAAFAVTRLGPAEMGSESPLEVISLGKTLHMDYRITLRLWAILLLAAGYGWAGGHFIPGDAPVWAYSFQWGLLLILFVLAAGFFKGVAGASPARVRRNILGLNVFAILTLLINIANVVRGAGGQGGHYGSKNSFGDLVPIALIVVGDILWLSMNRGRVAQVR